MDRSATEALEEFRRLRDEARENYRRTFGQRLQARRYAWEAVANLNAHHTLADVRELARKIEEETGFTCVQCAIHRDEGHVNERGVPIRNYHAHVVFFTLDRRTGEQLYRRDLTPRQKREGKKPMNRARMARLQDLAAEVLRMERGERGSKRKRLNHKQYREHIRRVEAEWILEAEMRADLAQDNERLRSRLAELEPLALFGRQAVEAAKRAEQERAAIEEAEARAKVKDVKAEAARLREELKEAHAKRAQYAAMEAEVKKLREAAKARELTIERMREEMEALRADLLRQVQQERTRAEEMEEAAQELAGEMEAAEERATIEQKRAEKAEKELSAAQTLLNAKNCKIEALKAENGELRQEVGRLRQLVGELKRWKEAMIATFRSIARAFGLRAEEPEKLAAELMAKAEALAERREEAKPSPAPASPVAAESEKLARLRADREEVAARIEDAKARIAEELAEAEEMGIKLKPEALLKQEAGADFNRLQSIEEQIKQEEARMEEAGRSPRLRRERWRRPGVRWDDEPEDDGPKMKL